MPNYEYLRRYLHVGFVHKKNPMELFPKKQYIFGWVVYFVFHLQVVCLLWLGITYITPKIQIFIFDMLDSDIKSVIMGQCVCFT